MPSPYILHIPPQQVLRACLAQWQLTAEHTAIFLLNYVGTVWETWDFAAADAVGPAAQPPHPYSMCTCHVYVC